MRECDAWMQVAHKMADKVEGRLTERLSTRALAEAERRRYREIQIPDGSTHSLLLHFYCSTRCRRDALSGEQSCGNQGLAFTYHSSLGHENEVLLVMTM